MLRRSLVVFAFAAVALAGIGRAEDEEPARGTRRAPPPLTGTWRLFLPSGFEQTVTIKPEGQDRFRIGPGGLVMSGLYEQRPGKLVMVEPSQPHYSGFELKLTSSYLLTLAAEPNTLAANYAGGVLFRNVDKLPLPGGTPDNVKGQ